MKRNPRFSLRSLLVPVLLANLGLSLVGLTPVNATNNWFADDFDDGAIDPSLWQVSGDGVTESGGVLNLFRNAADDSLSTVSDYDQDFDIAVEIRLLQTESVDPYHGIAVKDDAGYGIAFGFGQLGSLFLAQLHGTGASWYHYGPYQMNKWYQWRLVKSGATIDIYVDGVWICRGTAPEGVRVSFPGHYSYDASGSGTSSEIDNFSITGERRPEVAFTSAREYVDESATSHVATFTVALSSASPQTATVNYRARDDTATAGSDYVTTAGVIAFGPGEISEAFEVPIIDDSDAEGDEALHLVLSNPQNAVLGSPKEAELIIRDDEKPQLRVVSTDPAQWELDVANSTSISATFNFEADGSSIGSSSILLSGSQSGPHSGVVGYDSTSLTATIDPERPFADGETVTALLTKEIRASNGVDLKGFSWDFAAGVGTPSDGAFVNRADYATSREPRGVYAGDLDADGDPDLVLTSNGVWPNPGWISVLLNSGNGTFAAPVTYPLSAGRDPIALFGADLDGDGDIDLASAHNEPGTSHLQVLKNSGHATFRLYEELTPAVLGQSISGGDLDADGDVDLAMTDGWGSIGVRVMFNDGDGHFSGPHSYSAGSSVRGVVVTDIDNDGDLDIGVANYSSDRVSVLLNDGTGTFFYHAGYLVGSKPSGIYASDLNGDGWVDIASTCSRRSKVTVLLNKGNGTFFGPAIYRVGSPSSRITGGDFDGDGDIDLTLTGDGELSVILNAGDGTFSDLAVYQVGDTPRGVQAADFNLDGSLDIACANSHSDTVSLWFNSSSEAPIEADLSVSKTDYPDPVAPGGYLTYTLAIDNRGPSEATAVTLTDTLPSTVSFVSAGATQGHCDEVGGAVTCTLGIFPAKAMITATIVVTTPDWAVAITNTAQVTSDTPDPDHANNRASQSTSVYYRTYIPTILRHAHGQ